MPPEKNPHLSVNTPGDYVKMTDDTTCSLTNQSCIEISSSVFIKRENGQVIGFNPSIKPCSDCRISKNN